ncbi:MAG: ATP-binding protein [Candidatus Latescibacterota bacterium]
MNLLSNAVKFTEQGCIILSLRSADEGVEVAVADTGVGISEEDLPRIFEEFRQTRHEGSPQTQGSGLGLAIARKSVELLGGTLRVESHLGQGSTFTLCLANDAGHPRT